MSTLSTGPSTHGIPRPKPLFRVAFIGLLVVMSARNSAPQGPAVNSLSSGLSDIISRSGRKTVAVVDFTDLQGCVTELGRYMAEDISVALVNNAKGFEVIDRTNLKVLMQEHKLASTGIIDPATARKLGQVAGVDTLVTGTIAPLSDSVHVSAKALDTETAKMLGGITVDIPKTKTVEELLGKGVANCGPASMSAQEPPPAARQGGLNQASSDGGNRSARITLGDFSVQIQRCGSDRNRINCYGTAINQSSSPQQFTIDALKTYMVDDLGGQSTNNGGFTGVGLKVGANVRWDYMSHLFGQLLQPGLPVSFELWGFRMKDGAKSVSIVFVTGDGQSIVRDIALHGQ